MNYQECMQAILQNPENDEPRREMAAIIRSVEPQRAEFIERQLWMADHRRRTKYDLRNLTTIGRGVTYEEHSLLRDNVFEWSRDIGFYMGEILPHRVTEFDRGFVRLCSMNPYLFLEQGEHIMNAIAPLRGISFFDDPDGDPFPMKELAASPLLSRLEEIRFTECRLTEEDLITFAQSQYLQRAVILELRCRGAAPSLALAEALAANPLTRKCLRIESDILVEAWSAPGFHSIAGPIGEFYAEADQDLFLRPALVEMSPEGRELERRYGYIPWLHQHNGGFYEPDAYYWVEQGVLPRFVVGSPAEAPVPLGEGLNLRQYPLITREEWTYRIP
jgi:hypothetical protein